MSQQQPYLPPIQPPADAWQLPTPVTTWPKVVGIIMIVLGAYGLMTSVFGIASTIFTPILMESISAAGTPTAGVPAQFDALKTHQGTVIAILVIHGCLAGLLLAAGIGVLKRRRWSVRLAFVYAIARPIHATVGTIAQIPMQKDMFEEMSAGPAALPPGLVEILIMVTTPLTIAIGCALPLFLIIWLLRSRIRTETATWT